MAFQTLAWLLVDADRHMKQLALGVPVMAPGVGAAMGDSLQNFARGVVAPDRTVHLGALFQRRAGRADSRGIGDAVAAIEPAVGAPAQAVDDVVADGLGVEAIKQHLGLAIGHVVAVFIGDEAEGAVVQNPRTP